MLKNYLITAWRNLLKNKAFSIINIMGLALGMAACILIFQYVAFELSYDKFYEKDLNLYRVLLSNYHNNELQDIRALSPRPMGLALKEKFPEVIEFTRLHEEDEVIIVYKENRFLEDRVYYADSSFFSLFTFPLKSGDPLMVLAQPNSAVLSESMAKKYFDTEDPVGKTLVVHDGEGGIEYTVTGVFYDIPENSHISFDFLLSIHLIVGDDNIDEGWGWTGFYTYLSLAHNSDPNSLISKFPQIIESYYGEFLEEYNIQHVYNLQALDDIYLHSDNLIMEPEVRGNPRIISYMSLIALFVLLLAWFNYINLTTARALERAREVGVRKVFGAKRIQLFKQFLLESFIINIIGLALAITIVQFSHVYFEQLVGKPIDYSSFAYSPLDWGLVILFFAGSVLSGLYPAFLLSLFKPVSILKGIFSGSAGGTNIRKGLIILQFAISFVLISSSLIIYKQIHFMINYDLGFTTENILMIQKAEVELSEDFDDIEDLFFEEITKHPNIESVTLSFEPGHDFWFTLPIRRKDQPPGSTKIIKACRIDYNYFSTYQIPIKHGRNYSRDNQNDGRENILVNEKATEFLGFDNPGDALNQFLMIDDYEVQIIGIVKNFHQLKLRYKLHPVIYILGTPPGYYAVRLNTGLNHQQIIDHIKVKFDEFLPGNPFLYTYMDEYFNRQYRIEQTFEKIVAIFTILAIIIASLGLFGLSSLELFQRIKEIGIRKVHGARIFNILTLFSGKTLLLISISIFVAIPVTVLILNSWLRNFQFHIEIRWFYFIFPVLVMLFVSLVTTSSRIVKTANTNPAQSLRYE
jgi:putative ABC transport system permease protein